MASLSDNSSTTNSSALPSYSNSVVTLTPRQAYRRVRRVVELQWRGIAIVIIIIIDVIFFAVVFVVMDNNQIEATTNPAKSQDWLDCLIENQGDKIPCLGIASNLIMNQATITAVLILLSVCHIPLLTTLEYSVNSSSVTAFGYCSSCQDSRCSQVGTTWLSPRPSLVGSLLVQTLPEPIVRILALTRCLTRMVETWITRQSPIFL